MTNSPAPDLIPLAAAAIALGSTPASATVTLSQGRFPAPVQKQGRYNMVARADVEAEMKRRPHLTQAQLAAVVKAHKGAESGVPMSPAAPKDPAVALLAGSRWVTTAEVAKLLGIAPEVVNTRYTAGKLPFELEVDPKSKHGGRRAASLDVAAYLASQEPTWPTAEVFAAEPSLGLAEVKSAVGDQSACGANDPVTLVFLASRETITPADYALMLGIAQDTLKRRIQRGQVETVGDPTFTGTTRKTKRISSAYALAELQKAHPAE